MSKFESIYDILMHVGRSLGHQDGNTKEFVRGYLHAAEQSVNQQHYTVEQIIQKVMLLYTREG